MNLGSEEKPTIAVGFGLPIPVNLAATIPRQKLFAMKHSR
jgi:hypothetical protein